MLAASSIRATLRQQQQANSMVQYLSNYGQHVGSLELVGHEHPVHGAITLHELPHDTLQGLSSLSCSHMHLQLQPGDGFQGVLGPSASRKQLQFTECTLLDGQEALAAALLLLTELQHLSLTRNASGMAWHGNGRGFYLHLSLNNQQMQQLTHLELVKCGMQQPDGLQRLQGLTRLQDLRLECLGAHTVQASMLSGLQQLTSLNVRGGYGGGTRTLEPGALAGLTQLQHLAVVAFSTAGGSAGVAQLLYHLQHMQQLTHLDLSFTLRNGSPSVEAEASSAAAYSALTASSKLRHLNIGFCTLPAGAWQHMFPAGRQLPQLQVLDIRVLTSVHSRAFSAPEGSRLVSCCPGLQSLTMAGLQRSDELLAPLQGLSGLRELNLGAPACCSDALEGVRQLSRLRRLSMCDRSEEEELLQQLLQQLPQLKQLTYLQYNNTTAEIVYDLEFCEVGF